MLGRRTTAGDAALQEAPVQAAADPQGPGQEPLAEVLVAVEDGDQEGPDDGEHARVAGRDVLAVLAQVLQGSRCGAARSISVAWQD